MDLESCEENLTNTLVQGVRLLPSIGRLNRSSPARLPRDFRPSGGFRHHHVFHDES
jgi:hypothetical protein